MNFKSIFFRELGQDAAIEDIFIDFPLQENDVLVKTQATGVCLSDIPVIDGNLGSPPCYNQEQQLKEL